jgi:cytochrome c-type biogenesis protein CcmH
MSDEQVRVLSRRAFLSGAGAGFGSMIIAVRAAAQQQPNPRARMTHDSSIVRDTTNLFAMDQGAARPVRLPPKPNAVKQLTNVQRDALEHQLHCQCGCTLDVFTCRTTDFTCQVSPAMHRDVMALVEGGYSAQEIIDAFVSTYGDRVLMAPPRSGFNMLAWVSPGIAVLAAAAFILAFLRRSQSPRTAPLGPAAKGVDATDDELARIEAAVRRDDE